MNWSSIILTLVLLGGVALEWWSHPRAEDAAPFHEAVAAAVAVVPRTIGLWEGTDQPLPQEAQALLRPNVELSRQYRNMATGKGATVMLVQSRDTRDMAGHYPPRCYPANGWHDSEAPRPVTMHAGGIDIPVARYEYERSSLGRATRIAIYGCFVLPGRGFVTDVNEVYRAAEYYAARPFGAAQIQVIVDAGGAEDEDRRVFEELVTPLVPAIERLRRFPGDAKP